MKTVFQLMLVAVATFSAPALANEPQDDFFLLPDGADKGPQEPMYTFNGSSLFNFEKDLRILMADSEWVKLSESQIRRGMSIESQRTMEGREWGCGPNTGARALQMLGVDITDLTSFVKKCPKSWSFVRDVGPTPTQLADYLESCGAGCLAHAALQEDFSDTIAGIRHSIDNKWPAVVMIIRNGMSMHYVNVIGYNDTQRRVAIMDTVKIIYWMTYDELKWWLSAEGHFLKLFCLSTFNGLHFTKPRKR